MFEKLKEYGLYIVLSLIALGALAYAFLSTSNAQKGGEVVSKIQDELVTAIAKNQKVKDRTTIVDHFQDLNGLTIGSYKLDSSKVVVYNTNGDDTVTSGENNTIFLPQETTGTIKDASSKSGKLYFVMMPNRVIGGSTKNESYTLENVTSGTDKNKMTVGDGTENQAQTTTVKEDGLKAYNEQLRGFLATGYVGFASFESESVAKEFRDSFFSTGIIVKDGTTKDGTTKPLFSVFVEIAR